jgi:hypothetical protein
VQEHDGSLSPTSTYAISLPRTRRRCFWYGNSVAIMVASPAFFNSHGRTMTPHIRCFGVGCKSEGICIAE